MENLLAAQQEFLNRQQRPAANVGKKSSTRAIHQQRQSTNDISILSPIIEEESSEYRNDQESNNEIETKTRKKQSIFASRLLKSTRMNPGVILETESSIKSISNNGFPSIPLLPRNELISLQRPSNHSMTQYAATGEGESIHNENNRIIQQMTKEEIKQAQEEILSKLDLSTIQMLKSKVSIKTDSKGTSTKELLHKEHLSSTELNFKNHQNKLQEEVKEYPYMTEEQKLKVDQKAEEEKLKWTLPLNEKDFTGRTKFTRFGFSGTEADPLKDTDSSLFHHGDEPDRPGYTIQELCYLGRSTLPSQRIIALQILGEVIRNVNSSIVIGLFLDNLKNTRLQLVSNRAALVIRMALDDSNIHVILEAISCLFHSVVNSYTVDHRLNCQSLCFFRIASSSDSISSDGYTPLVMNFHDRKKRQFQRSDCTINDINYFSFEDDSSFKQDEFHLNCPDSSIGYALTNVVARIRYILTLYNEKTFPLHSLSQIVLLTQHFLLHSSCSLDVLKDIWRIIQNLVLICKYNDPIVLNLIQLIGHFPFHKSSNLIITEGLYKILNWLQLVHLHTIRLEPESSDLVFEIFSCFGSLSFLVKDSTVHEMICDSFSEWAPKLSLMVQSGNNTSLCALFSCFEMLLESSSHSISNSFFMCVQTLISFFVQERDDSNYTILTGIFRLTVALKKRASQIPLYQKIFDIGIHVFPDLYSNALNALNGDLVEHCDIFEALLANILLNDQFYDISDFVHFVSIRLQEIRSMNTSSRYALRSITIILYINLKLNKEKVPMNTSMLILDLCIPGDELIVSELLMQISNCPAYFSHLLGPCLSTTSPAQSSHGLFLIYPRRCDCILPLPASWIYPKNPESFDFSLIKMIYDLESNNCLSHVPLIEKWISLMKYDSIEKSTECEEILHHLIDLLTDNQLNNTHIRLLDLPELDPTDAYRSLQSYIEYFVSCSYGNSYSYRILCFFQSDLFPSDFHQLLRREWVEISSCLPAQ